MGLRAGRKLSRCRRVGWSLSTGPWASQALLRPRARGDLAEWTRVRRVQPGAGSGCCEKLLPLCSAPLLLAAQGWPCCDPFLPQRHENHHHPALDWSELGGS